MRAILLKKNSISFAEKRAMLGFLQWQAVIAVVLMVVTAVWLGKEAAFSVLLGALITLVPNVLLAIFIFMRAATRSIKQVVRSCYVGEIIKILLIAAMMLFILRTFAIQIGSFLIGLIGTYLVYFFSPVILKQNGC